ncbi:iron ABC transporter permease [Orbus sasakiae]|uniref:Iron ABC transporter permease n=1 Tax=Orbus sasakiae TaxID=1078475 RepID=A0ABP9N6C1_9GAMM
MFTYRSVYIITIVLTILLAIASLGMGHFALSPTKIMMILVSPFYDHAHNASVLEQQVIWNIRLPRILLAFFVGGGLALVGAVLQGIFYNPLVDPHIIGVTSGAAFGGTLAILLGISTVGLMSSAFLFGMLVLVLIFVITQSLKQHNMLILVLIGVILSGFFSALVSLMQYLADTEEKLPNIIFWLLGSFATASWHKLLLLAIPVSAASILLIALSWRINILSLADHEASSLGISVFGTRTFILILCSIIIAAQVAVSGSIGWIGLIIPHVARLLVGANHQTLLPLSFWLGGGYMILVDDIARLISHAEVPLGIITALLGAPCFVLLLYKQFVRKT